MYGVNIVYNVKYIVYSLYLSVYTERVQQQLMTIMIIDVSIVTIINRIK